MIGSGFWNGFSFGMGFELMRRVLVPILIIYLGLLCWWWLGPEKPQCSADRKIVAQRVIKQAVVELREVSRDIQKVDVLHLENDPTDFVTQELRKQLMEGGRFDLSGTPILEKLKNFLNLRNEGEFDAEQALKYAKRTKLDGVIIGVLNQFESTANGVVLEGMLKLIQVNTGMVLDFPLSSQLSKEVASAGVDGMESMVFAQLSGWGRLGIVVSVVLLLPILLIQLIKSVLLKESNGAILSVLVLITVFDGLAIRLLMGNDGFCGSWLVFCTLLLAAVLFNLFSFNFIRLRLPVHPSEY